MTTRDLLLKLNLRLKRTGNKRTIESLVRSCMKRYPVPLTAWAIGNIIHRNPASVSSKLSKLRKKGDVLAFLGKRQEILYASWDLNPAVQCWLSFNGTTNRYNPTNTSNDIKR